LHKLLFVALFLIVDIFSSRKKLELCLLHNNYRMSYKECDMKKPLFTLIFSSLFLLSTAYGADSSAETPIQQFMEKQTSSLSAEFPYRINLFTQGQIAKNKAGLRIAEEAKQFASDKAGQLFFYQLYNSAMRVPHWHANAMEIGAVLDGKMRVTIWDGKDKPHVFLVNKNQTWTIPQATLHALENVGQDKLTFIVGYNSPTAADRDFVTAWASLPDELLARTVGLTTEEISVIRKTTVNRLSNFDSSADIKEIEDNSPFSNSFETIKPLYQSDLGSIKRINFSTNQSKHDMAMQQTIMKPGILRLPHWYTAGDTLLYVYQGSGFFTMMNDDGVVYKVTIKPGDLISLPMGTFHSYLNIGKDDLIIYETFNTTKNIEEISLLAGAQQFSSGVLRGTTGLSKESAQKIASQPTKNYMVVF
jgi:oxalate decarboxylase/phosphoglucose isomerase-like protein (cupin superfamily)